MRFKRGGGKKTSSNRVQGKKGGLSRRAERRSWRKDWWESKKG